MISDWLAKIITALLPTSIMQDKRYFSLWENRGYHVTPVHFSEPIPETRTLPHSLWSKRSKLVGLKLNEAKQLRLLSLFQTKFKNEYDSFPREKTRVPYEYYVNNTALESVDGEILYCMIRHFRPRKIWEIGSGYSTYLAAYAIRKNQQEAKNNQAELLVIDPFPDEIVRAGFPGLSRLLIRPVQDIPLAEFRKLAASDILFVDSSHVLKIGSDVQALILEILPRLKVGVLVHFHDIFLPAEYPQEWVFSRHRFWSEQYLLQAFLAFNDTFEILWAGSFLHLKYPHKLSDAFASYDRQKNWPGSFWLRKIK